MGLFSFLTPTTPESVAAKIASRALDLTISMHEREVAANLGVEIHVLVSQRIQLMVGQSGAYLDFARAQTRRSAYEHVLEALDRLYAEYFRTRPGMDANQGLEVLDMANRRYIVRTPQELAVLFDEQIRDRTAWRTLPGVGFTVAADRSVSPVLTELVHGYSKLIATFALDESKPLVRD